MYLLLLLFVLHVNVNGESCKTPSGLEGECVPIRSCSSLLWAFTNPKDRMDDYLKQFVCSNDDAGLIVCCRMPMDYLVFENDEDKSDPNDITRVPYLTNINECGISSGIGNTNGIIRLQDFPWLIKIMTVVNQNKDDRAENVGCTGVLISRLYGLYSAQCHHQVLKVEWSFYVRIDTYSGKGVGCSDSTYSTECSYHENYEAIAYTAHPFYDDKTKINDIVIVRLSRPVHKSDYLQPICLPIATDSVKPNHLLQSAGWNRTYYLGDVTIKKSESSMLISHSECQKRLVQSGKNTSLSQYEMCTEVQKLVIDPDDIGFPLMSLRGGQWYLEGFESQVVGKTKVYTRAQNYLQWVKEAMGGERCLTPYNETGEGTEIAYCPKLLDAFANLAPEDEDELRKFVFFYPRDDVNGDTYTLKVCCGLTPNFTIPPETKNKDLDFEVSNFEYCGLQHRDDYVSTVEGTSVDEFPWIAVILNATLPKQRTNICGGTLITDRYVLTSGQCSYRFNSDDTMMVRLGDHNLRNASDCTNNEFDLYDCNDIQEYGVEEEIIHPFYNSYTYINDIVLLRLDKKVVFSDYVRPICLPRSEEDLGSYGDTLYATGFGDSNRKVAGPRIKKRIPTTLISNEECREKLKLLSYILPITPYHICTEDFKNSTDVVCEGDEGGPVMLSKKLRWFIVGISANYKCGDHEPQTHLDVFKFLKWIKLNIKD